MSWKRSFSQLYRECPPEWLCPAVSWQSLTELCFALKHVQLEYLGVTVQEKLRSGWPGPFVKVEGCCDKSFVCFQCEQVSLHPCQHAGSLPTTTRISPTLRRRTVASKYSSCTRCSGDNSIYARLPQYNKARVFIRDSTPTLSRISTGTGEESSSMLTSVEGNSVQAFSMLL
jgi:hypothetical protein